MKWLSTVLISFYLISLTSQVLANNSPQRIRISHPNYSDVIENSHKELQGRENNLDAQIANCRVLNHNMQKCNAHLEQTVYAYQSEIENLTASVRRGENQSNALRQTKFKLENELKQFKNAQIALQKELSYRRKIRAQVVQSAALDAEIHKLEMNLSLMKKNTAALAALDQRI